MTVASGGAIPVIDLAELKTPAALADAIKASMTTVGFLFIINHGLEKDAAAAFATSENFFSNETEEEKQRCSYKDNKGYVKTRQEVLDPHLNPEGDLKENFNIAIIKQGTPPVPKQPLPNLLNQKATEIADFQEKCFDLCQRLLEAFAIALNIKSDFFTSQHSLSDDTASLLRILHYPAVPGGAKISPNRAGAHSDYGSLTLLFQRSEGGAGLQILPSTARVEEDNWQDAGVVEGALVRAIRRLNFTLEVELTISNSGDAMEFWTGAQMKSTLHRVRLPNVIPPEGIPERYSIAFFCQPDPEAKLKSVLPPTEISPVDLERMARKGVTPGTEVSSLAHLQARLNATYKFTA